MPLRNRQKKVIGVVCLLNDAASGALPRELVSFVEALSGTAAIAIEKQDLLRAQKQLLESFIKLVAGAIDAKSPYTGGHCQRVPELATMLAAAACEAKQGPFRDFAMNDDEWETLHIAAWLHDCGKVTTPEYVVDKATKLQTIYDRLHEVRMRFEKFSFGAIRIDGTSYEHDVVVDRGEVRKRKKKPSKEFREAFGHTPISPKEAIPWKCRQLVIGTGRRRGTAGKSHRRS